MLFEQLAREPGVTPGQHALAHHVGKNDRGEFALPRGVAQWLGSCQGF